MEQLYSFYFLPMLVGLFVPIVRQFLIRIGNRAVEAPVVGKRSSLTARYDFYKNAGILVQEGYSKFKTRMFKLSSDDILVLPNKYVEELRHMPEERVSSIQANIDNFEGLYSTTSILLEGHLHTETIQSKLTPRLGLLVPTTQIELERGLQIEIPLNGKDGYNRLKAFHLVLRLVSYIAARHFVGIEMCRNEDWLSTAMKYTENAFRTIIFLRIFPDWMKPVVALVNPFAYRVNAALRNAKRLIIPLINERRRKQRDAANGPGYEKPNDLLQWMMDRANGADGRPDKLAHRLLILTLAAVHTTSMAATQTLFDLCVHPEYIEPLREELLAAMDKTEGKITKQTLNQLRRLDSFMRESQRLSPPSLLGFKRAVKTPVTLSDGTYLPKGVHLMMPIAPVVTDPEVTPEPMHFDGFRHYKNRQRPGEANKHQFATTSDTNLHFGHGKYACPGRFFASNTIKLLLANLLLRYEFRFPEGVVERPGNICLHEYVFPNPEAEVEFCLKKHVK
ncbi:putative cytochrome P450 monooxygenase [Zopfia rhizophila CBS 207.26]|uniref:Putative cytochrome P450 monooxygenase n=1 Tax=Zopfia rhizophila CBS 207.26 TaxID=1314779 RepID=A0A6A6E061_9PEZI|nr:putative cytochrome P450 monooxygenase [Zopfia rhizophila CBS 207.26]